MQHPLRRYPRQQPLYCTYCGGEIASGEEYWACNGNYICADCLPRFARHEFAPCYEIRGKESFRDTL